MTTSTYFHADCYCCISWLYKNFWRINWACFGYDDDEASSSIRFLLQAVNTTVFIPPPMIFTPFQFPVLRHSSSISSSIALKAYSPMCRSGWRGSSSQHSSGSQTWLRRKILHPWSSVSLMWEILGVPNSLFLFCFVFYLLWDTVSLRRHSCLGPHSMDQADLELKQIHLPLSHKCWN